MTEVPQTSLELEFHDATVEVFLRAKRDLKRTDHRVRR